MYYKFLLFDLDHTLLDFDAAEDVALEALLAAAGVTDIQAYKDYYVPMNKAMWEDLAAGEISKPELIRTRFAKLFAHFDQEVDGAYMAERYQHHLSQQGQVFDGVPEFLEILCQQGYRLFGATNGVTFIQKDRLAHSGLATYFEKIFISDEVGHHKPDKAFFETIAEQVEGFEVSKAVMIGDSLSADIQGGSNAGIDTIWFNPLRLVNDSTVIPTYIVETYDQIVDILQTVEAKTH
ncbi:MULTISPECIES: YjjG family noncanonical pyrimidine nucleotidase [Streptococcus]|uniref:YjjG family noncanonical pyrimidine nucleotidase n=1 Tax=Streptococcus caledonicus TaxID=2614158 RepID=A0ABW0UGZ5_9STRE|nr:YjjG family noncanonical pyrimidine nucleotidase [Streptococcus sp. S784/96/1]